ncbi:MAG: PH domain-containing protein [Myxococcota bacterium]
MHASQAPTTTFASKRDAWIAAVLWGGALMTGIGGFSQLSSDAPAGTRGLVFLALVAAAGFMLWVLYGTSYTFVEGQLLIRSGPFRFRVPLSAIDSVTPSRNPLSSPACSLDRLLIKWADGRRRILISPDPRAAFLHALSERCPHLTPEGSGLTRAG